MSFFVIYILDFKCVKMLELSIFQILRKVNTFMDKFNIDKYVNEKINELSQTDKSFKSIYKLMFRDKDFTMFEYSNGSRIKKLSYGEVEKEISAVSCSVNKLLSKVEKGSIVALYGDNSILWVEIFWAILKCGYKPLLLNTRMTTERLNKIMSTYNVKAVISDSENFKTKTIKFEEIDKNTECENIDCWADELIVMSSGTTENEKLCIYDGESFYYQILDSANIIKQNKQIKKHYEGSIKHLMFLPLYHIFGLAAMFMWFAFFSRTFVVLKDQSPDTIMMTIRKHKVTHIFAVPLFWETVYKKFQVGLKQMGKETENKFHKGMKIVKTLKNLSLGKLLFKQVREKIFGESICFLISGGGSISNEILEFFNSIGYPMVNGYGMSEVGITSVELSNNNFSYLTDGAVGSPFSHVEYKIENSELLVKGKSTAKEIYVGGKVEVLRDTFYHTNDNVIEKNGRYFICGRKDDVIIGADGENINPDQIEKQIKLKGCIDFCILKIKNIPTLLIEIKKFCSHSHITKLKENAQKELSRLGVSNTIKTVSFTFEPLISGNEFKLNRKRLENIKLVEDDKIEINQETTCDELTLRIKEIFAKVLDLEANSISENAHFFFDLNGSSLDYFALLSRIQTEFEIVLPKEEPLHTILDFYKFIQKNIGD